MKLRDRYDWVVLGDDPGALLSACLVARLGLSVLVIDCGTRALPLVSRSGQVLDPESNCLLGLSSVDGRAGLWLRCLEKLGLTAAESAWLGTAAAEPDFALPGHRLRWVTDGTGLRREWGREFTSGQSKAASYPELLRITRPLLLDFWNSVPERLTWMPKPRVEKGLQPRGPVDLQGALKELRKVRGADGKVLKPWLSRSQNPGSATRSELRSALLMAFGGGVKTSSSAEALLNLVSLSGTAANFQGGASAFREYLKTLAKRFGAHVPENTRARRIFIEKGKLVGIQLQQRGNVLGVGGAAVGCSLDHARDQTSLSGRMWPRRFRETPRPSGWRFTLALTVHADAIPVGVSSRIVWSEQGAPPLEIEVVDPAERGVTLNSQKFIFLRTLLPFEDRSLDHREQRQIAARMFRQLLEVMPFLEFHVIRAYPDFRSDSLADFEAAYPFKNLRSIPLNLRSGLESGNGTVSGIDGLFVVSAESFPDLGSLGPALAALEATAWVAHRAGIPGPLA